jgi:hydroxymethylpyrimidine/phosphomethylpyrimidine kinase
VSARPAVLVIAGSDSSGGAGIVRDLKVLADYGVEALCAITAVTAQTDAHLVAVQHVSPDLVRAQVRTALESRAIAAIKIGMLGTRAAVSAVADSLPREGAPPIVLDPLLRSSSGAMLIDEEGMRAMRARLFPRATLLTPNIPEAESLCGLSCSGDPAARLALARKLLAEGPQAVLLKDGHASDEQAADLLLSADGHAQWFTTARLPRGRRGTGCALASAIAASLALGVPLEAACRSAKDYVYRLLSEPTS